ncbi:tripartite tricarboxylate transporter permease [Allonocardiopsis opalescens]|uniref:Putative tricarboxylic transport membrane protein n=1 Tax=Allonocardiopsis opalescens TaxID=1144618 RepID=A0A2T0Q0F0_9ACTN|nr:tripartite tricarboxylate transporter permease [Allonocardiopsis opalescens]PRX97260.1 putative tricarboxylic transport membrane protein [Allonocardiopsis opalescens]
MDQLGALMQGFADAVTLGNLVWALVGVTIGTVVGVLPGIGPALTVAMLLPLTFRLDPASSLIMFAGIYYGGMYGGSTTSILLNTPGESASMVSALEGNKMARAGRGAAALATAAIGSFVAGTIGTIGLTFLAPAVAELAVGFGPPEYVALMALSFVTVSALLGRSLVKGAASLLIGLAIGLVGIDAQSGQARLDFGVPALLDGIDVVVVVVALFALGETFERLLRGTGRETVEPVRGRAVLSREDWRRSWPAWLRGTALGFPIGGLPAGGADVPTFLSYSLERRLSKHRSQFGKGAIEGVAGPEAANNAAAAGVLVPLLTIGLPTSATAAVILTAFQSYGLQPGPQLFTESGPLLWTLIASLYIGNVMLLVLNLPLVRLWARLLTIPAYGIYAAVLVFSTLGTFASGGTFDDLIVLYALGLVALVLRLADAPVAPAVVGVILGPLAETQLRRALALSQGDPAVLVSSPLTVTLWVLIVLALLAPLAWRLTRGVRERRRTAPPVPVTAVESQADQD